MQRARAELLRRIDAHADAEAMLSSHRHAVQDFRRRWTAAEVAAGASASLAGLRSDVTSAWDRMASAVTTFDAAAVAAVSASAAAVEAHRALVEATDAATAARMQLSVTSEAASRAREDLVAAQGKVTGLQQELAAGLKDGLTRFLHQEKQQAARKALTNAHTVFEGLQVGAAEQAATAREAETVRTACEQRAAYADETAQEAMALRGWPQSWGLPEEALATLIKALPQIQPASGGSPGASARWTSRLADRLRRPFQALKLRTAAPQVEIAIGPVTLSRSTASPTVVSGDGASSRPARIPARPTRQSGSRAVDHLVQVASRETARGVVSATSPPRSAVQGASAIKVPDTPPRVHIPAAYGRAKDFSDEIVRMFASPASGGAADSASAAAAGRLALALLDLSSHGGDGRPASHRLRYEQGLLIASALRSVTAHPTHALRALDGLRNDVPALLRPLVVESSAGPSPSMPLHEPLDERSSAGDPASADRTGRIVNATRRALASTSGGFQALLDLQGLAAPPENSMARPEADRLLELYKLGLRAEDALLAQGLKVAGSQSTTDVWEAIKAHPRNSEWLDAARLGSGNVRRRPGGPVDPEHRSTLAMQAFVYAAENLLRRAPDRAERRPELKPAYVALRNGFTESGQDSDFHRMAKRLRKFVRYIDLACRTPEGLPPTRAHRLAAPYRALRQLAGKDKSPLTTLLRAGPLGNMREIVTPRGPIDPGKDMKGLQAAFDAGTPAERRDMLKQIVFAATGAPLSAYGDGRRHAIGVTAGMAAASVSGLGGLQTGITPVVELNAERSRAAVLRTGMAEAGILYLGSERRVAGSVGAGVRVGAEVGPVFNVSAQAMARLGASHLRSRGLMIRTRTEGREHRGPSPDPAGAFGPRDERSVNERVVDAVFRIADRPPATRPAHGGAMWAQMVEQLGDRLDVSFGWNEAKATTADVSLSLEGMATAQVAPGVGVSATASAGIKHTFFDRKRSRDAAGTARNVQTEQGSRTALRTGASVGLSHPMLPLPSGRHVALFGRHRVGVETEILIQSTSGLVRIATDDGKVSATRSARIREFGVRDDFIRAVNGQREGWAKGVSDTGPGAPHGSGERKLDDFLHQLVNLPAGPGRLYTERQCLTVEAAEAINACMDRLALLQRPLPPTVPRDAGAAEQAEELQRQIAALTAQPSSWRPAKLSVTESQQAASAWGGGFDATATTLPGGRSEVDRLLGGGRLALAGKIGTAFGARELLVLEVATGLRTAAAADDATSVASGSLLDIAALDV